MRLIDEEYTRHPFYGYRKMTCYLQRAGCSVNHKRVRRLMQVMGLEVSRSETESVEAVQRAFEVSVSASGI